jgi:hypothetical protein
LSNALQQEIAATWLVLRHAKAAGAAGRAMLAGGCLGKMPATGRR